MRYSDGPYVPAVVPGDAESRALQQVLRQYEGKGADPVRSPRSNMRIEIVGALCSVRANVAARCVGGAAHRPPKESYDPVGLDAGRCTGPYCSGVDRCIREVSKKGFNSRSSRPGLTKGCQGSGKALVRLGEVFPYELCSTSCTELRIMLTTHHLRRGG